MHSPSSRIAFLSALLGALLLTAIPVIAQNELVPAPNAVKLERVWTREGEPSNDQYGYNVWGGVDLTGDSIADFGVYRRSDNTWLFYEGGDPPDTVPFWSMDSVGSVPPYVGSYWGDGRLYMLLVDGYPVTIDDFTYNYDRFRLFEVTSEGVRSEATIEIDHGKKEPPIERFLREVFVLDINNDSIDDMVVSLGGLRIGHVRTADLMRQVWIYLGGPTFQLDSPTVVIRDTNQYGTPDNWEVRFSDFDGDGRTDMLMGGSYPTGGPMLRFYWGDDNSPWSWAARPPDRDLQLIHGQIGINSIAGMGVYDLNGDGAADMGSYEYEDVAGSRIYLSRNGRNARNRSFTIDDADYYTSTMLGWGDWGHINDSGGRYATVGFSGNHSGWSAMLNVSGSSYGPDHDYEAWYAATEDGLNESPSARIVAADVTGDGYDDQIHANYRYGDFVRLNSGIAIVLKGGPYIPFDDTTLSVMEYPVAGESGGLYLWPNPVVDELHIAWMGNLKKKPSRFAVFDLVGREVVSGEVDAWRGAALWRCGSVTSGTYMVVAYDADNAMIATARIVKR